MSDYQFIKKDFSPRTVFVTIYALYIVLKI